MSDQYSIPRFPLHTALLTTLAGVLVACGETVTLESGRSYELPSNLWYWSRYVGAILCALCALVSAIVASFAGIDTARGDDSARAPFKIAVGFGLAFAGITWLLYPGSVSPAAQALETAKAEDAALRLEDPEYQRKIANETLDRVVEKRDAMLRPEMARQQQLYSDKRAEIATLMTKTNVASHEELLHRAEQSVELLHLKNLVEEAAIAQRAVEWLAVKINQHDMLAEQLRSQVARLDSIIALQGVATAEELKGVRSVVNGAVVAIEENLTVPEREDQAVLAAKLFDELKSSPTHQEKQQRAPESRQTALNEAGR